MNKICYTCNDKFEDNGRYPVDDEIVYCSDICWERQIDRKFMSSKEYKEKHGVEKYYWGK